jgi:hypothetical protein
MSEKYCHLKQSVKLNEDMEKVQGWCTSNDMVINTMKSKSMIMGSSRKIQYLESNFNSFLCIIIDNYFLRSFDKYDLN